MRRHVKTFCLLLLAAFMPATASLAADTNCAYRRFEGASFAVCSFDAKQAPVELHLYDASGAPYGDFQPLASALAATGRRLAFAMNGGMYQENRAPVGLYVEHGKQRGKLRTGGGYGNFHLRPNGVFYVDATGAHVRESLAYARSRVKPRFATQSGPMLVTAGRLHPRFSADSPSRLRRNGVGVSKDGSRLHFVMADGYVNLHQFARFFRDELKTPDALYLDGNISRLYAPELARNDWGARMGPIIAVVVPARSDERKGAQPQTGKSQEARR